MRTPTSWPCCRPRGPDPVREELCSTATTAASSSTRLTAGPQQDHLLHPLAALQEERPGHHRVEEQPPGAQGRLRLPLRHRGKSATYWACSGPWSTTGSTTWTPTKKPIGFGTDRRGRRTRVYHKGQHPAGVAPGRQGPVPSPAGRADCLPRPAQPRRHCPLHSPSSKPCCSNWPRTRPRSSTSPASPAPYPISAKASASRPPDQPSFAGLYQSTRLWALFGGCPGCRR